MLTGGLTCIGTPQVGHGEGADEVAVDLGTGAGSAGGLVALEATALRGSFDSGCSIGFVARDYGCYFVKRIQRFSAAARFSQPVQGLIPIA